MDGCVGSVGGCVGCVGGCVGCVGGCVRCVGGVLGVWVGRNSVTFLPTHREELLKTCCQNILMVVTAISRHVLRVYCVAISISESNMSSDNRSLATRLAAHLCIQ